MQKLVVFAVAWGFFAAGCTQPGETTGMAAATGGVIGAGLGAIVGSQTGDAGTGLVIGAVAGSSAGALVGNAIEAQEQTLKTQDEAIERQERMIATQRAEIEELRRLERDGAPVGRADGSRGRYGTSRQGMTNERTVVPYGVVTPRNTDLRESTVTPALRSAQPERSVELVKPQPARIAPKAAPVKSAPVTVAKKAAPAAPVTEQVPAVIERETVIEETVIDIEPKPEGAVEPALAADVTGALQGAHVDGTAGAECANAAQEVEKAGAATDSADKLFHLRRALRLCPDNALYHNSMGEVYLSLDRRTDAEFEFREALRIDPKLDAAVKNLTILGK